MSDNGGEPASVSKESLRAWLLALGANAYDFEELALDHRRCAVRNLTLPVVGWAAEYGRRAGGIAWNVLWPHITIWTMARCCFNDGFSCGLQD